MFDLFFIKTQEEFMYLCLFYNLMIGLLAVILSLASTMAISSYRAMVHNSNTYRGSSVTKTTLNKKLGIIIALVVAVVYIIYHISTSKISVTIVDGSVKAVDVNEYIITEKNIVNKKTGAISVLSLDDYIRYNSCDEFVLSSYRAKLEYPTIVSSFSAVIDGFNVTCQSKE